MNIAAELLALSLEKQIMLTCAESCTGGMVAAALTDLPGSSAMFDRGFVTYTNQAKMDLLGVPEQALIDFGAVSEPVAAAMAEGALNGSEAALAVSITGIAGPGGSEHKPEGRVCFGVASRRRIATQTIEFGPQGRDAVRRAARDHALALLVEELQKLPE
ncbi:CinA family protein [Sulfitobacter mediterraneus]|uniref:CinA family protein n=1 Tax=Sulfitobacter mediterraneus TaxID=83219 RepID=UPI00193261D9|nr:CinA family protein [Sulfitobacter mediterraneus]MBM1309555.1 CinA family protein [Sulfitobacter mediterraneus]MBM1313440.1 CinA family protein [Sulfitobacter mediterraneus]MBM1321824.1 CinA family protein [Sulfitobacter mediterraneus]MBM1325711.1 CinA family protein [Sulfitobacter mediterraneus]MBM1397057.1 CinA family protein [Sulfitobacter mediterraneus]